MAPKRRGSNTDQDLDKPVKIVCLQTVQQLIIDNPDLKINFFDNTNKLIVDGTAFRVNSNNTVTNELNGKNAARTSRITIPSSAIVTNTTYSRNKSLTKVTLKRGAVRNHTANSDSSSINNERQSPEQNVARRKRSSISSSSNSSYIGRVSSSSTLPDDKANGRPVRKATNPPPQGTSTKKLGPRSVVAEANASAKRNAPAKSLSSKEIAKVSRGGRRVANRTRQTSTPTKQRAQKNSSPIPERNLRNSVPIDYTDYTEPKPGTIGSKQKIKTTSRKPGGRRRGGRRSSSSDTELINTRNMVDETLINSVIELTQLDKTFKSNGRPDVTDPQEFCQDFSIIIPDLDLSLQDTPPHDIDDEKLTSWKAHAAPEPVDQMIV